MERLVTFLQHNFDMEGIILLCEFLLIKRKFGDESGTIMNSKEFLFNTDTSASI